MHFLDKVSVKKDQMIKVLRSMRYLSVIMISVALMAVASNFYMADAVFAKVTSLPFYVMFFLIMFLVGMLIEYASLWCKRDKNYYCAGVAAHCLALLLVTYETGAFYSAGQSAYAQPPSYSLTAGLSHILTIGTPVSDGS